MGFPETTISFTAYAGGAVTLLVLGAALLATARAVRSLAGLRWTGPPAWLADIVVATAGLLALAHLLGAFGLFTRWPLLLGAIAAALITTIAARRSGRTALSEPPPRPPAIDSSRRVAALLVVAVVPVLAVWIVGTWTAYRHGPVGQDSVWYHLPLAARFFQTGSLTELLHTNSDPLSAFPRQSVGLPGPSGVTTFYPSDSSVVHAVGMIAFGRDLLSPALNLGWLGVALLAAWCVGRPYGVAPATMLAVGVVAALPTLALTQPGEGTSDTMALALVISALAFMAALPRSPTATYLAALAAGLAIGTKLTVLAPVAALTVAAVISAGRESRVRVAVVWAASLAFFGGYWFVRNLVHTGSPMPLLDLSIGPIGLPSPRFPALEQVGESVADYATRPEVWQDVFVPGLRAGFGTLWVVVLLLAAVASAVSVVRGPGSLRRALGATAIVAFVAYLFTPQSAGAAHAGGLFAFNLRFLTPGLALGLMALALLPPARAWRSTGWVPAVLAALAVITAGEFASRHDLGNEVLAATVALLLIAAGGALVRSRPVSAKLGPGVTAVLAVVLALGAGWPLARYYLENRYSEATFNTPAYAWADEGVSGPIGVMGTIALAQYPLTGRDLENRVEYVGRDGGDGELLPARSCREWRRLVVRGRYRYIVTSSFAPGAEPVEASWTRSDPAAEEIVRDGQTSVFRLRAPLSADRCGSAGSSRLAR